MGSARRQGRGRLSRLDRLPEAAQADLIWLNQELRDGSRLQTELRDVFNARLAVHGVAPISNGAFSRYSVRKALQYRELDENRRMASDLVESLGVDSADKATIALTEMIKMTAVKLIEAEGAKLAAKDLMELSRAAQAAVGAQKQSAEYRRSLEREFAAKLAEATKEVVEIGKAAGVTAETMQKITDRLKGVA